MTYRRDENTWPGRIAEAVALLGSRYAAQAAGVSESRLRQLSNPMRNDAQVVETLFRLDAACAAAGQGTPLSDLWQARLGRTGPTRRERRLEAAVHVAVSAIRAACDRLLEVLAPPFPGSAVAVRAG